MTRFSRPDPVPAFAAALVDAGGVLAQILAHMERSGGGPAPEVLVELLADTLGDLRDEHGDDAVEAAARVLWTATELVVDEIMLVPRGAPDGPAASGPPPCRSARRTPRGRRR